MSGSLAIDYGKEPTNYYYMKRGKLGLLGITLASMVCHAETLHYDKPAQDDIGKHKRGGSKYMQESLPLGNGRLGTMFSGGVAKERLLFNEITLWANGKRGEEPVKQSGNRVGAYKHLEEVREAYRNEVEGSKEGSMEALSTKYLATQEPLGNYARFTDVVIETGHDDDKAEGYRRALNIMEGIGSVEYSFEGSDYKREYFCSYVDDATMARYTSSGADLDLTITLNMICLLYTSPSPRDA